ncbi:glucan endo-1,3-beta-glucosidase 13 [Prosopis cineraria]|uniref:glucan endo-1,3-beta-glucosidase 13 n=1 Tax=Prosopis cineraria TaxID=364024 RepID=UPI0024106100|nr:glucan endo-1,3-beta-glucosidase 13 [Prosopis cineraria]
MGCLILVHLLFLSSLVLTGASQDPIELLNLCETTEEILQASSQPDLLVAVSVSPADINGVSRSILSAERWLRSHVFAHYPATKITTVVVGNSVLCQRDQKQDFGLILLSLKNVYHSLRRWGLEKEIKVSVPLYLECLHPNSASYKDDLRMLKPLIDYLRSVNSSLSVIPHSDFSQISDKSLSLVSSHLESMKKFGFLHLNNINVIATIPKERKPIMRKLSFLDTNLMGAFPARPTPLPEIAEPPLHSTFGHPVPSHAATKPMPPLAQTTSPPMPSFAPELPPFSVPASSPNGFTLPPCNPADNGSPEPAIGMVQKLWCVAKPSVPAETLQEAMDYACGAGGADCQEISPQGNCYNPDIVVAHASYAFNSYWQKHKRNGGTCDFGGTAMLISSDPSFLQCRFVLS